MNPLFAAFESSRKVFVVKSEKMVYFLTLKPNVIKHYTIYFFLRRPLFERIYAKDTDGNAIDSNEFQSEISNLATKIISQIIN